MADRLDRKDGIKIPEKRDLMGEITQKASIANGYSIEDMNKLWESLRE